jgi:hypothetical protein
MTDVRPEDLVDYEEAARLVDRGRSTLRGWVREGQLRSWPAEEGKANARRLVSRSELLQLAASAKTANPGGPGRGDGDAELRVLQERVEGLKLALEAERARASTLEALVRAEGERARAEGERAHVERLRAQEWQDRCTALEAERNQLRPVGWWQRLLGG